VSRFVLDARTATGHFPGIGRYTFSLARAMGPLLDRDERLILLRDPARPSPWDLTALVGERVQVVDVPFSPFSLRQQWAVPRLLHRLGCGLYHNPYYLMPYRPGLPTVVTIYDLIPLRFPETVSLRARWLFRWATALALRTASHILAISQATRRDLLALYHLSPQKVTAIPLAVDPAFRLQPPAEIERVRRTYGLPERYVLYLGINKPHKNLLRLIEAWHLLVRSWKPGTGRPQLVIAGPWDARYPEARERVGELDLSGHVRFLGFVLDGDLPALYSGATLFLFPSLYEGFGLPALEAMACGTPVVCSNTSNLPEIVGQAALTFDPLDVAEMAARIEEALGDTTRREEMRAAGLRQAAHFSWEETARRTMAVYRSVARRAAQRGMGS